MVNISIIAVFNSVLVGRKFNVLAAKYISVLAVSG